LPGNIVCLSKAKKDHDRSPGLLQRRFESVLGFRLVNGHMGGLLPRRIQGRTALLVGDARWLLRTDGRLANGIGLTDSDSWLTDLTPFFCTFF